MIPKNQIKENLYTSGGEFNDKTTGKGYAGYYCVVKDKYYIGKIFNFKNIPLEKINKKTDKTSNNLSNDNYLNS